MHFLAVRAGAVLPLAAVFACGQPRAPVAAAQAAPRAAPTGDLAPPPSSAKQPDKTPHLADDLQAILRSALGAGQPKKNVDELRRAVESLRSHVDVTEQPVVDRVLGLLDDAREQAAILDGPGTFDEKQKKLRPVTNRFLQKYVRIARDVAEMTPDDAEAQMRFAGLLYGMPDLARSLLAADAARDDAWRKEGLTTTDALLRRYPTLPALHSMRGMMCMREHESVVACLHHFADCMKLEGGAGSCAKHYHQVAVEETSPRCNTAALRSGLTLHVGSHFARPDSREIGVVPDAERMPDSEFYVTTQPGFALRDLVETAHASVVHLETTSSNASGPPKVTSREQPRVSWTVKPGQRAAFDAWLAKTVEPHISTWLVVLDGKKWVGAGPYGANVASEIGLSFEDMSIDAVCAKTFRPTLPADLPPP